jgi:hypothetical protein
VSGTGQVDEAMRIVAGGNVGIGTSSPGSTLDVANNTPTTNTAQFGNFGIQSYSDTNGFVSQNFYFDGAYGRRRKTGEIALFQFGAPASGDISFRTAGSGAAGSSPTYTEALVVKNSGKVGIGTTTPGQKLTVEGTLGLLEGGSAPTYHTILQGGDQTGDVTYTLPVAAPTANGQVLSGTTAGVLSWSAPSADWANPGAIGSGSANSGKFTEIQATGQAYSGYKGDNTTLVIDWGLGNSQVTNAAPGTFSFSNMKDGGYYTLVLTAGTAGTFTLPSGGGNPTWKCNPECVSGAIAADAGKDTILTILKAGSVGYVSWIKGF